MKLNTGEVIAGFEGTAGVRNALGDVLDQLRPPIRLLECMGKVLDEWLKEHNIPAFSHLVGHSEGGLFAKYVKC